MENTDRVSRFFNNLLPSLPKQHVNYEFFKDKTYRWINLIGEEANRGVYEEDGTGGFSILPKNWEHLADERIRFENEQMVLIRRYSDRDELREFRFTKKGNIVG